ATEEHKHEKVLRAAHPLELLISVSAFSASVLSILWNLDQQWRALGGGSLLTWREFPTLYPIAAGA
ncbi:MAG: hypothetical protein OXU36_06060, partial [Candidatus Poribacteria bacterium]|nr:hypothetical protein [Candidatus Poribacteria bacterium]